MKIPLINSADVPDPVSPLRPKIVHQPDLSDWLNRGAAQPRSDMELLGELTVRRAACDAEINRLIGLFSTGLGRRKNEEEKRQPDTDVFRITSLYRGIYSRVARKLGVTPSVVRRVALNKTKSKRISKALSVELRRVEKTADKVA